MVGWIVHVVAFAFVVALPVITAARKHRTIKREVLKRHIENLIEGHGIGFRHCAYHCPDAVVGVVIFSRSMFMSFREVIMPKKKNRPPSPASVQKAA